MQIILFFLIFIIGLGSLITTFIAIIQILSNDFKESKITWIFISMIAFIGPILWLTKGRKLIVKNGQNMTIEKINKIEKPTLKKHYSELIKNSKKQLSILSFLSIFLILFGYFVRLFDIYFFWESKSIGFGLLLITIAKFLFDDINARRKNKLNRVGIYIVFGFLCLVIFIKAIFIVIIPNSNAYDSAKEILRNDSNLIAEVGEINSFSYLPKGSMSHHKDKYGTTGSADLTIIVKGEKKYLETNVVLRKELEEDWKLIHMD
ncbi:hypothetical protein [Psychroserpens sp. S379A]|uniref:hypothetical protein n=1 Tax=Psychroserpens sp. S379A TaxID=3415137 RepID=UPI003C7D417D